MIKPAQMIKKPLQFLTGIALTAVLLAGCGSTAGTQGSTDSSSSAAAESSVSSESEGTTAKQDNNSNVLVVYYSATGNTKAVAETIADALDADTFEITPAEPYSDDDLNWSDEDSRVVREHEDESLQDQVELTTTKVKDWDSYDTVFIGYPIWWGIAAWPVNQFIQKNDFSGKTVIPFCTSASSGIGESGKNLADMAGTGNWQEGHRFASGADESEVTSWAQSVVNE